MYILRPVEVGRAESEGALQEATDRLDCGRALWTLVDLLSIEWPCGRRHCVDCQACHTDRCGPVVPGTWGFAANFSRRKTESELVLDVCQNTLVTEHWT